MGNVPTVCAPCCGVAEDPGTEVRTEVPSYQGLDANRAMPAPYGNAPDASYQNSSPPLQQADEYAPVMVPPAPMSPGGNPGGQRGGGGGAGVGLTADAILSDLDGAEMKAYQDAFVGFGDGSPVPLDNAPMREFLQQNGDYADIEMDLLQAMNDSMQVEMGAFLQMIQSHAISQEAAIGQFTVLSQDGNTLASEECRTGLTMMGMDRFSVNYANDRWDNILNMVMMDAGPSVDMEQWIRYAQTVARYIRLFQYCNV